MTVEDVLEKNGISHMFCIKYAIKCEERFHEELPTVHGRLTDALDLAKRYRDGDNTVTAQMIEDAALAASVIARRGYLLWVIMYPRCASLHACATSCALSNKVQWQILKDLLNNEYSEVEQLILGLKF